MSIFNRPSSLVTISEDLLVDGWQLYYFAMSVTRIPARNIPIVPDFSCLEKRGMINKVIKLNFQCFSYMYNYGLHVK